ncbi:unnamed protein product [Dibothriocephalus latus]|uniref:Uncharacterized protein n=1 Tax=Dibothriocephalus latus TaxID=60516 RepID=A0A3P6RLY5_DIBLA|nr:unnamed protein product [Dibothriocephalus latus]
MQTFDLGAPTLAFELRPPPDRYCAESFNAQREPQMTRLSGLSGVILRGQELGGFLMKLFTSILIAMFILSSKCLMHGIVFILIKISALLCQWKYLRSHCDWFNQNIPQSTELTPRSFIFIRLIQSFTGSPMKFFSSFLITIFIRLPLCLIQGKYLTRFFLYATGATFYLVVYCDEA